MVMYMFENMNFKGFKQPRLSVLFSAILLASGSISTHAGKITSVPTPNVGVVQDRFGGVDFENIDVVVNGIGSTFDELTGAYSFSVTSDLTYIANVYDDDVGTTTMGYALAKDWPVGEPAGIKIVNDDFDVKEGRPTNCIMSTSYLVDHLLDSAEPEQVLCSGPFQSHKRYKLAMLDTTVAAGAGMERGIDLVFNVEQDGTSRDYQVFQKINNWTDERLEGFTIQVGTGLGANFVPASDPTTGVGVANLSLSVPSDVWNASQLATFSSGLFGPIDLQHGRPAGYFDESIRAGYKIVEYGGVGSASAQTDTLTSGDTLGSTYTAVPVGAAGASVATQFGNWLPDSMLPYGIFYDDDANPDTDAQLIAWYGYNTDTADLRWMKGAADNYDIVADATITNIYALNPLYSMGEIDDLVNIGLNYIVTIADISTFPGYNADPALNAATFTIRITPKAETVPTADPAFAGVIPTPSLAFASSDAIIALNETPDYAVVGEFVPGSILTVSVADADLNTITDPTDPAAIETTTVDVSTTGGVVPTETVTLTELGPNRGVFAANLPDSFSNVAPGVDVTVTYTDVSGGATDPEVITATLTAAGLAPPGTIEFNPVAYTVEENDGTVDIIVTRTGGTAGEVAVEYHTISGSAIGGEDYVTDTASVVFADGDAADKTITVTLINDDAAEDTEKFTLLLSNAQGGATLGAADTATVTITDLDVNPPGTLQFNPVNYSVARNAGTVTLTVERTGGEAGEATVEYLTLAGTAKGDEDYVIQTGTVTFGDGSSTSQEISIDIIDDGSADGNEVFTVQLSNVTVADLGSDDVATVTISDMVVYKGTESDGLFGFSWITLGLALIALFARARSRREIH